jgi:preprotein translocase subunit SecF
MQILQKTNYNFIKWRWHALALSLVIIIAGMATIATKGLPLGIDFTGGTVVRVRFDRVVSAEEVQAAVAAVPGEKTIQQISGDKGPEWLIRLPQMAGQEEGRSLEAGQRAVFDALNNSNLKSYESMGTTAIGPIVGQELRKKGVYATLTALLGIMVYIALRFRLTFAVGAIAATLHDILIVIVFLTWFGYDFSLNIVAAILTITGYSVNDTIVVFDRVRENLRNKRRDRLEDVVNASVNDTLSRTIITAGTTFLAVAGLYLFGGPVLEGFAFTMLVGIIAGTYSTIFIASAIAILLSGRKATGGGTAAAVAADAPAPARPRRGRRAGA